MSAAQNQDYGCGGRIRINNTFTFQVERDKEIQEVRELKMQFF